MSQDYRYEIKFVLNETQLSEFEFWMRSRTSMQEAYPERVVNSLYFDDVDYRSARDNITGLANREKFRFRWYGDASASDVSDLRLERKAREGRLGHKKNHSLDAVQERLLTADLMDLTNDCSEAFFQLGLSEGYMLSQLFPTLYVNYRRQYFSDSNDVRITIDDAIEFANVNGRAPLLDSRPIPYSKKIIEIKFSPDQKDTAAHLIKTLHLVPKRCSKYLHGLAMLGVAIYI